MRKVMLGLIVITAVFAFGFTGSDAQAQGWVTGVVLDVNGERVAGARVMLHQMMVQRGERPFNADVLSNENGEFGFRQVPAGIYWIGAMSRELQAANRFRFEVVDNQENFVRIQLQACNREREDREDQEVPVGNATISVVNADNEAVVGARVHLSPVRMENRVRVRGLAGETGEDGTVTFENIPAVNYIVMAGHIEFGRGQARLLVEEDGNVRIEVRLIGRGEGGNHRGDDEDHGGGGNHDEDRERGDDDCGNGGNGGNRGNNGGGRG